MSAEGAFRNYVGGDITLKGTKSYKIKFYEPKIDRRYSLFQLE
jgi:hypothetical protein